MFLETFYLQNTEKLEDAIVEFLLDQNIASEERKKRFEMACLVANTINKVKYSLWEDFKKKLREGIVKEVDQGLKVEEPEEIGDPKQFFKIYKENWLKDNGNCISYYISNNTRDGHRVGLYCEIREEGGDFEKILEECSSFFDEIREKINVLNEQESDNKWEVILDSAKDWGGIAWKQLGEVTGWVNGNDQQSNCAFWAQYIAEPEKIIKLYIENLSNLYRATYEVIDKFVEECNVWK